MDGTQSPFDLKDPAFRADPYPSYARLRRETPVVEVTSTGYPGRAWMATRYHDVVAVLKDPRFVNDRRTLAGGGDGGDPRWLPRPIRIMQNSMVSLDNPDHARLRALVHKAFTPRMVEDMAGRVERIAAGLLDRAIGREVVDLIADFALPLPMTVISEMLGVPEKERGKFRHFMSNLLDAPPEGIFKLVGGLMNNRRMIRYLDRLIAVRRARPDDGLITALILAEEAGDRLDRDELVSLVFLLLLAGHETTLNLIGNGTLALLENPDQLRALRDDPALIRPAVEELLRFTNPVQHGVMRYAREDVELGGVVIPRRGTVVAMIASANRDEGVFDSADRLILSREPNRHLSFGLGIHSCLGAPLARMEAAVAINALLRRAPDLQLAVPAASLKWRIGASNFRGLKALPVRLGDQPRNRVR